jgi:ORF6N domain
MQSKPISLGATELVAGIESRIYLIRGQRVMLSHDLAALYGVETKVLLQSMRRNLERFPIDFQFSITNQELTSLRSQFVTSNSGEQASRGGLRYAPVAFTEQGIAMLSSVLRSPEAVAVNIQIMRTFVKLRSLLGEHKDLKHRLDELERKYDGHFKSVFDALHQLMDASATDQPYQANKIGFTKGQV